MTRKILSERKIDVIHAHWLIPQGWIAHSLSKLFNISFIVTSHGGDLFGLQGNILTKVKKKVAEDATAMTVVSQAMKEYLEQISIQPLSYNNQEIYTFCLNSKFSNNNELQFSSSFS